ncbi:MAG: response regulator [Alphaproteobacteria bacterium]|nr:response regulator [Alphaproteobacteria bacterium]
MKRLDVLIVEDDADLAEAMAEALELAGHSPTVAGSGTEAIDHHSRHSFDMTFMDVKLPDINGVDTFLTIREMHPDARVVMMTGYQIDHLLALATDNGAIKVLRKPFTMEAILDTLHEFVPSGLILIADDDPEFVEGIRSLLALHGYDVLVAGTGREAVDRVLESSPDVLLLDLRLPVLHGLDVYLELKRRGRSVPTIVITGYPKDEIHAINTLKSLEIMDCLFKPVEPDALIKAVENIDQAKGAPR